MLGAVFRGLLDLIWPPRTTCLLCAGPLGAKSFAGSVCDDCLDAMDFSPELVLCQNCTRPMESGGALCLECARGLPFGRVYALGIHEGPLRQAIHLLKFEERDELGIPLGRLLSTIIDEPVDYIVPVPLHRTRHRERGYNQAALLARGIGVELGVPVLERWLIRLRPTENQANLDRAGRLQNLKGAFGVSGPSPPWDGRTVLMVDDVLTTGATAGAAAAVMERTGARVKGLSVLAVSGTPVPSAALST